MTVDDAASLAVVTVSPMSDLRAGSTIHGWLK